MQPGAVEHPALTSPEIAVWGQGEWALTPVDSRPVQGTHCPRQLPRRGLPETEPRSTPRSRSLDRWTEGQRDRGRLPSVPGGQPGDPEQQQAPLPGESRWRGASKPS